jgi:hypothetical protein
MHKGMWSLSKLAAVLLVLAFAANAECTLICFASLPAHSCCQHKTQSEKAHCANKVSVSSFVVMKSVKLPFFVAQAIEASFAPAILRLSRVTAVFDDPPGPFKPLTVRRI